jgi:GDPmannose 4,6-dehydratase
MLQQDRAEDYVVASGRTASVRDFVQLAFAHVGRDWQAHVTQRRDLLRPAEVDVLRGDPSKARERLGWASSVTLEALAGEMVEADLERHRRRLRA